MEEFEQMSLTEASFEPYRIKNKIRLIELFGGIGAQAKALEILGADFEHYRLVDGYYAHRYKLRHWKVARIEEIK